jgi:hypothetical protein
VRTDATATCEVRYVIALMTSAGSGPTSANSTPPIGGATRFTLCSVAASAATAPFTRSLPSRNGSDGVCAPKKIEPPVASTSTPV